MTIETGSARTQYKKIADVKRRRAMGEQVFLQVGQYMDSVVHQTGTLSRLLHKEGSDTFLHGENVDDRFLRAHYAKKIGVMLTDEPQQAKMVLKDTATRHLSAISRILGYEVEARNAEKEKVA